MITNRRKLLVTLSTRLLIAVDGDDDSLTDNRYQRSYRMFDSERQRSFLFSIRRIY